MNEDVLKQGRRPYNEDVNEDVLKQGKRPYNEDVDEDVLKQGRRPYNEDVNEDVLKQGRSDNALLGQEINVQHEKMSCNICFSHAAHRQKYTDARFEYQREKDPEAVYFTACRR